ncbi:MAG: PqqD family protein [Synechococcus sp. ChBW.bin.23]
MVSSTKRFKQHHQAVCTELDGDIALFQSNTCDYLVLNETGSAIWNALKTQPTLTELCKHLQGEYEVTSDECKSSIETWLEAALEKKVIAVVDD